MGAGVGVFAGVGRAPGPPEARVRDADAERDKDTEIVDLFRRAQADSRKGAEIGKRLLRQVPAVVHCA